MASEEPAVEQRVIVIAVNQRRWIVGARRGLIPGDVLVRRFARLETDIALGAGLDGEDRTHLVAYVAGGDVEQSEFGKRRGNDDRRHAAQLPEEVAVQIVGANSHGSRGDQLGALAAVPDVGRGPVALLVPLDAPDLLAGLLVEGEQER